MGVMFDEAWLRDYCLRTGKPYPNHLGASSERALLRAEERLNDPEAKPKRRKYGNIRVEVNGMKFDSKHEAAVYEELSLRLKAGEIRLLLRQVPFDLPGGIRYIADFCTIDREGAFHVMDAKSEATRKNRVYINKKKQMKACWGLEVEEV